MAIESELDMYLKDIFDLVIKYKVYIKPHPGNSDLLVNILKRKCEGLRVIFLALDRLIPSEIIAEVIQPLKIFSYSSNVALLERLGISEVVFLINDKNIRKYFYSEYRNYIRDNLSILYKFGRDGGWNT